MAEVLFLYRIVKKLAQGVLISLSKLFNLTEYCIFLEPATKKETLAQVSYNSAKLFTTTFLQDTCYYKK